MCGRIFSIRPARKLGSFVQGAKASMCLALFELHSPSKVPFEVYTAVVHLLKKAVLNTHHVCRGFHQEGASPPEPSPRGRASPPGHRAFRVFPRDDAGNARRPHREGYGCAPHPMNPHRCGHTLALAFPDAIAMSWRPSRPRGSCRGAGANFRGAHLPSPQRTRLPRNQADLPITVPSPRNRSPRTPRRASTTVSRL